MTPTEVNKYSTHVPTCSLTEVSVEQLSLFDNLANGVKPIATKSITVKKMENLSTKK